MAALAHDRQGSGEPLVLLHGLGHRRQAWAPVAERLVSRREVTAVDLPGFGESPPDPAGTRLGVADHADRIGAFAREQRLERPHYAGSSLGGAIALELARRGEARSVTAFSPTGFWGAPGQAWCRLALRLGYEAGRRAPASMPPQQRAAVARWMLFLYAYGRPSNAPDEEVLGTADGGLGAPGFLDGVRVGLDHRFGAPQELRGVPVTIAWGRRDVLLPAPTQARRARRLLPWARHLSLPGCGHVPFYDDPDLCAAVVLRGSGG